MTTTKTHIEPGAYRLTGITKTTGQCDCCTRTITQKVFAVAHKRTGQELTLGRRCAAKATGYPTTAIEREAKVAARLVEVARRRTIVAAEYPQVAKAWADRDALCTKLKAAGKAIDHIYGEAPAYLGDTAACEDGWWGGYNRTSYGTWQAYLNTYLDN